MDFLKWFPTIKLSLKYLFLLIAISLSANCISNSSIGIPSQDILQTSPSPTIPSLIEEPPLATPTLVLVEEPAVTIQPEQIISTATPTSLSTVASIEADNNNTRVFSPIIALQVGRSNINLSVAIFDTKSNNLELIAQPTDSWRYGKPLWAYGKSLLAFSKFDSVANVDYIEIYDLRTESSKEIPIISPIPLEGDDILGVFFHGWSKDSEWLAYCYIYESTQQQCAVTNTLTQQSTNIENFLNSTWFAWSNHSNEFAMLDNEAIYIGNPNLPNELTRHQGANFLGRIVWHPFRNAILVSNSDNLFVEGLNKLSLFDVDTNEWVTIGSFPDITHFAFSPDAQLIAIYSHSSVHETYQLQIIDGGTFSLVKQIELPAQFFPNLAWLDNQTVALTSRDNIYVIPLAESNSSYWLLDSPNILYQSFTKIYFSDWYSNE